MEVANIPHKNRICMTEYLIAARTAIILWTNLAVMPAEMVFDVIEAELERRGAESERPL
jgi:DNA phosphorothioation-dependent restriction protein DptG